MMNTLTASSLTLTLGLALAPPPQAPALNDAAFIAGCWRSERGGRTVDEQWMAPAGSSMLGMSRTVAGGKTSEYEFLQIQQRSDGLYYVAKPSGQAEASFKLVKHAPGELVFENPAHDFPQRILYRRTGDTLTARIEGSMNGKARGIDFPYARVACPQ
jgi:Domain of unknown function (DUF6265)